MKREPNLIVVHRTLDFQLDPTLTGEEAIALRALAAGQTDRQVCKALKIGSTAFLRLMRAMRTKIGTGDDTKDMHASRELTGEKRTSATFLSRSG